MRLIQYAQKVMEWKMTRNIVQGKQKRNDETVSGAAEPLSNQRS